MQKKHQKNNCLPRDGIIIKKSKCCNAPITTTTGGIIVEICSKCKKSHHEQKYKNE